MHRKRAGRWSLNRARPRYLVPVGIFLFLASTTVSFAQEPDGPQTSAPPPATPAERPALGRRATSNNQNITVPAGTRVAVVLENGISTRNPKAGDALYSRPPFPFTRI